ncbi:coiled-coil domain-containing protein 15 isoform X1 [Bos indicus x Bos taurus]|uniref:Coiled-coil domain containing 15 n=1 Tax=Bos indicus x Bos taurus TaxID=30522 RepID=A0A4W2GXT3_BOBOX|nr:coiled-coil domain-containing protein 15 isoform X1 [Bos indicus x Bos taurus]XP_027387484.1 coiled-coil domain-containing protein 15 isoform X1 [Bos indicus x Bos taurus]XP_027387485.1 coiled-coil domain-containing protein 15 isoform X1 [Bos indicus x Bos taurus]XP_027387486.1 coiled-coil domain-containing protein 15 isoform X1 [Bos indicus x Bos taurus]
MPRSMAPLKKPRNTSKLPLALNPLKSKNVLAVLAERNQAIVPVGAWVEPAPPDSSEVPAATSAYIIEEELKEQLRKKQEALKHFQRQVKSRVNQQIRLRKKQQLQRSYEAAEKEGSIAMYSSDPAHLTPKRTSVFPSNLNAAIGRARLPPPQMLEGGIEDRENQSELFQQQAQALSQSMKQARHRLASFKTVNQKDAPEFPDDRKKSFPTQEKALCRKPSFTRINIGVRGELPLEVHQGLLTPADYQKFMDDQEPEESSSVMIDKKGKKHLSWGDQEALFPEDKDIPFSRVQKVQFKTPLFDVIEEEEVKQLHQDILPEAQDYLPEAQGDLTSALDVEWEAQRCEPRLSTQHIDLEGHTVEPKAQAIKTKTKSCILKDQTVGLEDGDIALEVQDLPLQNQTFLPTDQHILPKDQNIQPECQDQDFLPSDQKVCFKETYCDMNEKGRKDFSLASYQYLPPKLQYQASIRDQSKCIMQPSCFKKSELGRGIASGVWLHRNFGQASHNVTDERWREELFLEHCECVVHEMQDPVSAREKSLCSIQQPCVGTAERWQEDLLLDGHHHLAPKQQREASSRKQVGDEYQSGLNTEFQTPLALQSGVSQEEDKKERQKQYLRYRRLFMDIEREQVKEQQRQKEHKKKIEKIKKKKEQQRYAEEQRILRMKSHEEPCSGEKMSEILAQLQLEEIKGAREKQQQKEKEYQRYVEALRAQIQEKMQLYNITLPPLCCCGPDFWDAHPDTCANNCIFYKNHKAYTRALHSVVNSCDIPEGNSDLRVAIHNFASAHRRTLKNL